MGEGEFLGSSRSRRQAHCVSGSRPPPSTGGGTPAVVVDVLAPRDVGGRDYSHTSGRRSHAEGNPTRRSRPGRGGGPGPVSPAPGGRSARYVGRRGRECGPTAADRAGSSVG